MSVRNAGRYLIAVGLILLGIALTAYPLLGNYLYEQAQEAVSYSYEEGMEAADSETLSAALSEAQEYNRILATGSVKITDPFDPDAVPEGGSASYSDVLNLSGNGIMCFLEIPCIDVDLPVYHGTSEHVLKEGVGHLENTSVPVGGESTHAVLSAHTGLMDKKMFTDLAVMEVGDRFYIHVLGETLAYEVDSIRVVEPEQTDDLQIVAGQDLVTLVTCTPYGINSHRLLVRGHRVPFVPDELEQTEQRAGSTWMQHYLYSIAAGVVLLVVATTAAVLIGRKRENDRRRRRPPAHMRGRSG